MNQPIVAQTVSARKLIDGRFTNAGPSVIIERELKIILNGSHLATASLMPGMEREFVTGYLFGQGFIKAEEADLSLDISGTTANVTVPEIPVTATTASYRIVSGGGRTAFADAALPEILSGLTLDKTNVFKAMNQLFSIATVYQETEGVHAAGIFTPQAEPVCVVEDIGRHNCLDKAIGYCLLNNVDCGNHIIVSTGRMASEMVAKLCRAGFPVATTKTAVTDRGRQTAENCGMTLIGFVRDTGTRINTDMELRVIAEPVMKIYTHPDRITCK